MACLKKIEESQKTKNLSLASEPPTSPSLCPLSTVSSLFKREKASLGSHGNRAPSSATLRHTPCSSPSLPRPYLCAFLSSLRRFSTQKDDLIGRPWKPSTKLIPTATGVVFSAVMVAHRHRKPNKNTDDVHHRSPLFNHRDLSSRRSTVDSPVAIT